MFCHCNKPVKKKLCQNTMKKGEPYYVCANICEHKQCYRDRMENKKKISKCLVNPKITVCNYYQWGGRTGHKRSRSLGSSDGEQLNRLNVTNAIKKAKTLIIDDKSGTMPLELIDNTTDSEKMFKLFEGQARQIKLQNDYINSMKETQLKFYKTLKPAILGLFDEIDCLKKEIDKLKNKQ